jgi:hypothetical protein
MCIDVDSCSSAIIAGLIGKNYKAVFGHSPTGLDHYRNGLDSVEKVQIFLDKSCL